MRRDASLSLRLSLLGLALLGSVQAAEFKLCPKFVNPAARKATGFFVNYHASHSEKNRILIFDTTRDGEQCPALDDASRKTRGRMARLKVDVIEGGFRDRRWRCLRSVRSLGDQGADHCRAGAMRAARHRGGRQGRGSCRQKGRIHVFLATSKLHREFKLGKAQSQIIKLAVRCETCAQTCGRCRVSPRTAPNRTGFSRGGLPGGGRCRGHHIELRTRSAGRPGQFGE